MSAQAQEQVHAGRQVIIVGVARHKDGPAVYILAFPDGRLSWALQRKQ
jgi:hypothetical protein